MSVPLLTTLALCPCGVHSPASAHRLQTQSSPDRDIWRVLSTTSKPHINAITRFCNTRHYDFFVLAFGAEKNCTTYNIHCCTF